MTGYVYAISDGCGRVKLGFSKNPKSRFVKVSTDNGAKCALLGSVPATREQEQELHTLLSRHRLNGEWFDESAKAVRHFISFLRPPDKPPRKQRTDARGAGIPLKAWRIRHGLDQGKAAKKLGMTQQNLSMIENGRSHPSLKLMRSIIANSGGELCAADFVHCVEAARHA